jgi:hypothetical protein
MPPRGATRAAAAALVALLLALVLCAVATAAAAPLYADECFSLEDERACGGAAGCVWCESAAVASACYTAEQARGLPPAVFDCKALPSA